MTWGIHDDVSGLRARIRYPILFQQHAHDPDDTTETFDTKVFTLGTHEADRLPPRVEDLLAILLVPIDNGRQHGCTAVSHSVLSSASCSVPRRLARAIRSRLLVLLRRQRQIEAQAAPITSGPAASTMATSTTRRERRSKARADNQRIEVARAAIKPAKH